MSQLSTLLRKDAGFFLALASVSLMFALVFNALRDNALPLVYENKEQRLDKAVERIAASEVTTPSRDPIPEDVSVQDLRNVIRNKEAIVLDARAEIFYRFGHIPGALSLPRDDFEAGYAKIRGKIEVDKNWHLVIYCAHASCEDSGLVEKALKKLGYKKISMFRGGWAAWTQAGLPEERTK